MRAVTSRLVLALLLASASAHGPAIAATDAPAGAAATPPAHEALEPGAVDLLKQMSARLAAARTLSFTATTEYESPSRIGPPLVYTTRSQVLVERPARFRVVTPGDGPATEVIDDGKSLLAWSPAEDLVAVTEAPPTIDEALRLLYESASVYFPFSDVIVADPYGDIAEGLERAFVVGRSQVVGGTTTDIVAMVAGRSFQQIWIGSEDRLPRRIRAVYAHDPSLLRHDLELSDWKLDAALPAAAFAGTEAMKAKRIPFAHPEPRPPEGARDPFGAREAPKP